MKIAQGIRDCRAFIFHISVKSEKKFQFWGSYTLVFAPMGVKCGVAKFHPHRCNVSPLWGEKPQNRPVSKLNTGRLMLRAMLPVKIVCHHQRCIICLCHYYCQTRAKATVKNTKLNWYLYRYLYNHQLRLCILHTMNIIIDIPSTHSRILHLLLHIWRLCQRYIECRVTKTLHAKHNARKTEKKTRNVGQCPTWWSPCRI